jgi:hypothetical protein
MIKYQVLLLSIIFSSVLFAEQAKATMDLDCSTKVLTLASNFDFNNNDSFDLVEKLKLVVDMHRNAAGFASKDQTNLDFNQDRDLNEADLEYYDLSCDTDLAKLDNLINTIKFKNNGKLKVRRLKSKRFKKKYQLSRRQFRQSILAQNSANVINEDNEFLLYDYNNDLSVNKKDLFFIRSLCRQYNRFISKPLSVDPKLPFLPELKTI